jgi:hypothetical protein
MGNTLTAERIKQLLEEIKTYEDMLRQYGEEPQTASAWATLAIAKAKLKSLTDRKTK